MALRNLRINEDEILRKKCRVVEDINDRIITLIKDMKETMYASDGVGLAAPQVGILKRIVIIDVGNGPITFINPEIIEYSGSQTDTEGCLSLPGVGGEVTRANYVKVKALDEQGKEFIMEGDGLFARAVFHELDHLDGVLFTDRVNK